MNIIIQNFQVQHTGQLEMGTGYPTQSGIEIWCPTQSMHSCIFSTGWSTLTDFYTNSPCCDSCCTSDRIFLTMLLIRTPNWLSHKSKEFKTWYHYPSWKLQSFRVIIKSDLWCSVSGTFCTPKLAVLWEGYMPTNVCRSLCRENTWYRYDMVVLHCIRNRMWTIAITMSKRTETCNLILPLHGIVHKCHQTQISHITSFLSCLWIKDYLDELAHLKPSGTCRNY